MIGNIITLLGIINLFMTSGWSFFWSIILLIAQFILHRIIVEMHYNPGGSNFNTNDSTIDILHWVVSFIIIAIFFNFS